MLRIRDVYLGSRIRISLTRIQGQKIPNPGSGSASKNLSVLTQKIVFKLSKIWSGLLIPDPDPGSWFLPIQGPGVKKAPDSRSRIRICSTGFTEGENNRGDEISSIRITEGGGGMHCHYLSAHPFLKSVTSMLRFTKQFCPILDLIRNPMKQSSSDPSTNSGQPASDLQV